MEKTLLHVRLTLTNVLESVQLQEKIMTLSRLGTAYMYALKNHI